MSLDNLTFVTADVQHGPPPPILSPDRPGNDPTIRTGPSRPAEGGVIVGPDGKSLSDANGNALTPIPHPTTGSGPGLGVYFLGALAVTAMADTTFAPLAVALLLSAAIYNANPLLDRIVKKSKAVSPNLNRGF